MFHGHDAGQSPECALSRLGIFTGRSDGLSTARGEGERAVAESPGVHDGLDGEEGAAARLLDGGLDRRKSRVIVDRRVEAPEINGPPAFRRIRAPESGNNPAMIRSAAGLNAKLPVPKRLEFAAPADDQTLFAPFAQERGESPSGSLLVAPEEPASGARPGFWFWFFGAGQRLPLDFVQPVAKRFWGTAVGRLAAFYLRPVTRTLERIGRERELAARVIPVKAGPIRVHAGGVKLAQGFDELLPVPAPAL